VKTEKTRSAEHTK